MRPTAHPFHPYIKPNVDNFLKDVSTEALRSHCNIVSTPSGHDDLIAHNLRWVRLLEEKALLRDRGIVGSEKLKKVKLKEAANLNEESLKANSNLESLPYVDIASVSTGSIDSKTEYDVKDAPGRARRILKHQDIIWSCVRPNRKSYSLVWQPEENLIGSTSFAVITATAIPATFLYQLVTSNEFVSYLENHAKGATYPAVTAFDFEDATLHICSDSVMKDFHEEAYQCYELKHILQQQNTKLREAREMLMGGVMGGGKCVKIILKTIKMDVIALQGDENRGKSETLNIVYQMMLLFGFQQVPGHFNDLGNLTQKDFIDILEKKGVKVGIVTLGDYDNDKKGPWSVNTYLDYLENQGCDKAICAFRHKGMPLTLARITSSPNHVIIPKDVTSVPAERRIRNGEDAERIYQRI